MFYRRGRRGQNESEEGRDNQRGVGWGVGVEDQKVANILILVRLSSTRVMSLTLHKINEDILNSLQAKH